MNTITLPKNQFYVAKLSKIEKGLSAGKGIKFKTKSEIKKFFQSLFLP